MKVCARVCVCVRVSACARDLAMQDRPVCGQGAESAARVCFEWQTQSRRLRVEQLLKSGIPSRLYVR